MPFKLVDNVLHISSTNGQGDLALTSPSPQTDGYQSFDLKMSAGDTLFYTIWDDVDYEVGLGTVQGSPVVNVLQRNTVYRSSSPTDQFINWQGGGDKNISCALPSRVLENLMNPSQGDGMLVNISNDQAPLNHQYLTREMGIQAGDPIITWENANGVSGNPTIIETEMKSRFARKDQSETFAFDVLFAGVISLDNDILSSNSHPLRGAIAADPFDYRDLIQLDGTDAVLIGSTGVPTKLITDGVDTLTVDYGSGAKKIWHESNLGIDDDFDFTAARSITAEGYYTFPGGFLMQWGKLFCPDDTSNIAETYPIEFPNAVFSVAMTHSANNISQSNQFGMTLHTLTTTGFLVNTANNSGGRDKHWIAVGN